MKRMVLIVLCLLFVFGISSLSFAATRQVTGKVTSIDRKAMTVTVHGRKGDVTASVDKKTRIVEGKEKRTLADVQEGAKVTLRYRNIDGKDVAKKITIRKAAPVKKAETPAREASAAPGY